VVVTECDGFSSATEFANIVAMADDQLNLFSHSSLAATPSSLPRPCLAVVVGAMADDELIAAIAGTHAGMADTVALAEEAGLRKLASAVPALATVCRRFTGFGTDAPVPEQVAAISALAAIGGPKAADAVARTIERREVTGQTLAVAVWAAARLESILPIDIIVELLRHAAPAVRADACRCSRADRSVIAVLADLLDDLNATVHTAAACALGRMGRPMALPALAKLLDAAPTIEVVEAAAAAVADDDTVVLLGRLARNRPDLADAVVDALDACDTALAAKVAASLRSGRR